LEENEVIEEKLEELNKKAMEIIVHAGDARHLIMDALDLMAEKDKEAVLEKLEEAHEEIKLAHKAQTGIVQKDVSGDKFPHSYLFAHAQDTLMTVYSEYNIAKKLVNIVNSI
jgi:PTS system cellobiose-specific IIA component